MPPAQGPAWRSAGRVRATRGATSGDLETVRGIVRYCRMTKALLHEDAHSEKLLDLAGTWRKAAAGIADPYRSDMMRRTAEELERAAARATRQAPAIP